MSDVHMVWFLIDETTVSASRKEVIDLAAKMGFSLRIGTRDSRLASFTRAGKVSTTFKGQDGKRHGLSAVEVKRTTEFIVFDLLVDGDESQKVAEWKLFQARRNRVGVDVGTQVIKFVIKQAVGPLIRTAVQKWQKKAEAVCEAHQQAPVYQMIRQHVRSMMLGSAVPILHRDTMYFLYDDDVQAAHTCREFLAATTSAPGSFTLLDVDDHSDLSVFAASADAALALKVDLLNEQLMRALRPGARLITMSRRASWDQQVRTLHAGVARHQRRLRLPLVEASQGLLLTDRLVSELPIRPASRV